MPRNCRPAHLGEPSSEPMAVAGCDVCAALADQRAAARANGDESKVTDYNVEIRDHPHPTREGR
ncbi:hypothetical protein AB0I10_13225 [Streptomyces sp. NPDC050636]|uniref:hypothetical protein n=1 Tax=Streptomyces sp. NPDC050636 TaxID=3154510 RepID=UPI00341D0BE2